jgi:hypothetical protein
LVDVAALTAASLLAAASFMSPELTTLAAEPEPDASLVAYVDGREIPPSDVGKYFCDDFSYPVIRCSTHRLVIDLRATMVSLLTGVDYVTIYDLAGYSGSFMNVSNDYGALATIGWNDRISSFKGRNSETGRFWTDWFNGGISSSFCCNTTVSSLGIFDNAFSSMQRT